MVATPIFMVTFALQSETIPYLMSAPNNAHQQAQDDRRLHFADRCVVENTMNSEGISNPGDTVATWNLKLNDGPHKVTFEHGTTSGKRVITVDGQEVS